MPRKSLAGERVEQILDAFEKCVVKYGLEGSSLEKIGDEAGMKRTILRHYIGNREDLVHALCERVVERWQAQLAQLRSVTFTEGEVRELVDALFMMNRESGESILIAESLIAAVDSYPEVEQMMKKYIADHTKVLSGYVRQVVPTASPSDGWEVAYGLLSILFNEASLVVLKLPPRYRKASKAAAMRLVNSL